MGKTTACCLCLIQKCLTNDEPKQVYVYLTSSKEICKKNANTLEQLSFYLKGEFEIVDLNNTKKQEISKKKYILLSTPKRFVEFLVKQKFNIEHINGLVIEELDFGFSFGYEQDLSKIGQIFAKSNIFKVLTCNEESEEIEAFKSTIMTNSVNIKMKEESDDEEEEKQQQKEDLQHYYYVLNETQKFIVMYMVFKLRFFSGKSIILCKSLEQAFKVQMFFERTKINNSQVYNPKNPKRQKSYILNLFNTGLCPILITSYDFFEDLDTFTIKVQNKEKKMQVKQLANLFQFEVNTEADYYEMSKQVQGEGMMFSLFNHDQTDYLSSIVEQAKDQDLAMEHFPMKKSEIDALNYRVADVIKAVSNKQVKSRIKIEFQKQLCKSKDL